MHDLIFFFIFSLFYNLYEIIETVIFFGNNQQILYLLRYPFTFKKDTDWPYRQLPPFVSFYKFTIEFYNNKMDYLGPN